MKSKQYQPKTGAKCGCKRGVQRDNCPNCEGTGMVVDFAAIRSRVSEQTQHTPGPWRFSTIQLHSPHRNILLGNDGNRTIANIEFVGDDEENEANARLIAATPELLAALEQCLPPLQDAQNQLRHLKAAAAFIAAEAAITKATKP